MKTNLLSIIVLTLTATQASAGGSPAGTLAQALECRAGNTTATLLKQHGIAINGERQTLQQPVPVYGASVNALSAVLDRDGLMLYVELPMRQKTAVAKAAGMRHDDDDDGARYTKTLASGATLTIDDTSDEGDVVMLECRI